MLVGSLATLAAFALIAQALAPRLGGVTAIALSGCAWTVVAIGILTLLPAQWDTGIVPADARPDTCSMDYGGPAPDGFWILSGSQRMLNVAVFVPAGALWVLGVARWRRAWVLAPLGLAALALYSFGIEVLQFELARIDRSCDVTDVVDNITGALVGGVIGLVLALLLRPWGQR
ncbi:MAG: VanZ family protein [Nocardioides sp.]|nr:VanZ family protein [Nocardioides sp.]